MTFRTAICRFDLGVSKVLTEGRVFSLPSFIFGKNSIFVSSTRNCTKQLCFLTNSKQSLGKILFQMMLNFKHFLGAAALSSIILVAAKAQSPILIKDIRPNQSDSWSFYCERTNPNFIKMNNGKVFFFAEDQLSEPVPMLTDGTAAGTARLADVYAGIAHIQIYDAASNKLYFTGRKNIFVTSKADEELWVTDGTKTGTVKVKDIEPTGEYGSEPHNFVMLDSKLYFAAEGSKGGFFITDGTEAGTIRLSNAYVRNVFKFKNKIYLSASANFNGNNKLWETDGTMAGTKELKMSLSDGYGGYFVTKNNLYVYDGFFLKNLDPSTKTLSTVIDTKVSGGIGFMTALKGKDYFFTVENSSTPVTGKNALYETDGTEAGTKFIKELNTKILASDNYAIGESFMAIQSENPKTGEKELLLTNGTVSGTFEVDLNKNKGSDPRKFCQIGDRVYFSAKHTNPDGTKDYGNELMVTDGTVAGTKMVLDFASGPSSSNPVGLTYINFEGKPNLFFFANSGPLGDEPYRMEVPLITPTVEQYSVVDLFTLFPNPSNGIVHIITHNNELESKIELLDISGRIIYQDVLNSQSNTINISLENGMYFVKVTNQKGEFQTQKLMINRN
jgi:ELWxxDGT repeat protein